MFWKISFYANPAQAQELGNALEEHVPAVSTFEVKDPDVWVVEAITTDEPDLTTFKLLLEPVCKTLSIPLPNLKVEELPETDWLEATWRNFPPLNIGRYYVYGSHTNPEPPSGSVCLEINAATAFGSGEHETTTGCLLTLDDLASEGWKFKNPLDMGCGSGILGIAIAKTWNIPVTAADNDPESVRVATNNAVLNQCEPLFEAYVSEGFANEKLRKKAPYDIIVANILKGPLVDMAEDMAQNLAPGGYIILSGLLNRDREEVVAAYKAQGIRLHSLRTLNDWVALLLEKA